MQSQNAIAMCKRKDNLEKIKTCQTEVNFRLDFFARPGSLDRVFAMMPKDMDYFEYKPTEEDQQIIWFDDVASCLRVTLTDLLYDPCKVLKSKDTDDLTIYIHRNFVSVQRFTSSSDENEEIASFVSDILQPFLDDSDFNVEDISSRVTFAQLDVKPDIIWNVFDHTAFPVLEDMGVLSGSYQDTRQIDGLFFDLTRDIQTNEEKTIDGVVTAKAFCKEEDLRDRIGEKGLKDVLSDFIAESIGEITRCFTE